MLKKLWRQSLNMDIFLEEMKLADLENIDLEKFDDFWNKNILREELLSPSSYYIIAKSDNDIIGFAGIKFLLDEAHITNIVTRIDKRNNGIRFNSFRSFN